MTVMILIIAACSSSEDDASTGTTAPTPVTTTTTAAIEAPTTTTPSTTQEAPTATSEATATYTGGACTHDGPSEIDLNSEVTFTLIDETESDSVGLGLWAVPAGTTTEQIHDDGIFSLESGGGENVEWSSETQVSDFEWQFTVTFSESGLHAVNCYDTSGGEHGGAGLDYPKLITVND